MAFPLAASTAALAAYLNAKFHLVHDIRTGRSGLTPTQADLAWAGQRAAQNKVLTSQIFQEQVQLQPSHLFLIFEGKQWTYAEFWDATLRVANWLGEDLGVEVGEVVALAGGNSPEHIMLWMAIDAIGAVTSFINNNITGDGLAHCVKLCKARYLLADIDLENAIEPIRSQLEDSNMRIKYYDTALINSLSDARPIPTARHTNIALQSPRTIIYTSGTTGYPKGVPIITARELLVARAAARYLSLTPSNRIYTCMPLYHGAGHALCLTPVIHGGSTLILGRKFSHATFWPEVAQGRATIIQYVGELCRYLLNGPPNAFDSKHVVKMAWGNGMRADVWEPFRQRFNIPIINELYAGTDAMGTMTNRNEGPFTRHAMALRGAIWNWRFGGDEVRVKMDVDGEEILRDANGFAIRCVAGEPGQVLHRLDPKAPVAPVYFNNAAATEKRRVRDVFKQGDLWFASSDMMVQDESGRVFFTDRLGDTFRWKSENVSTTEVANVLGKHPDIAEANVYGVSVPGYDGRAGAACIILVDGVTALNFNTKGLAEHAKAMLPSYAVPLFLRVTPSIEYTGTMKAQKGKLKREGIDPDLVTGGDMLYWLPLGSDRYVPFGKEEWEGIKAKKARL